MKLQDYIVPIVFSFCIMFGMRYFFGGFFGKWQVEDQASFTASRPSEQSLPLQDSVQYETKNNKIKPILSTVHTNWGEIGFSSVGGAVTHIEHNIISNRKIGQSIQTISMQDNLAKQAPMFLLAFENNTPLYYNLDSENVLADRTIVQYSVNSSQAHVVKKFIVHHNSYRIDLELTITPKATSEPLNFVRVLFQSPRVTDANGMTAAGTVIVDKKGQTQRSKDTTTIFNQGWITPELFGTENQYFAHILFADKEHDIARAYYTGKDGSMDTVLEFKPINSERTIDLSFYMGPKEQDALVQVDQKMASIFEYQGLLAPIYKFLFMLLKLLYKYLGNFGIAIIMLTFLIKILLLPLTIKTETAQQQQKEFEKKMNYINQKYKHDDERLQLERAEIIKSQGFSMIGTLMLAFAVQIPLFMCLNYMLGNTVELYNAPFLWIPDLSGRDPFYILPLFVTGVMIAQTPTNSDAKKRMNTILIAMVFGAIATRFSAGLGLYFVANTALAIAQTFLVKKFGHYVK